MAAGGVVRSRASHGRAAGPRSDLMSALAGRWNMDCRDGAGRDCERMLAAQTIYGPHDRRSVDDGDIAIGRNLYRTLPEDRFDAQPLAGADGRYRMVADVRLDNRDALVATLGLDGATMPDSAVLLAAWERWEETVFDHLLGDFAFAVWDARDRRLILARDALGARPLHYHRGAGFVAFASMPKGLHALADIPYAPDEERVAELLALIPEHGPQSFFRDIRRVESGHCVTVTSDGERSIRHWNPTRAMPAERNGDPVRELRGHLDRAVAARLRGAGSRIGAHLSGGWDSGAVAATAARLMAAGGGTVTAFTSVPRDGYDLPAPDGRIGDEGRLAAATAALHPNIDHVLVRPDGSGMLDGLDRYFHLFERPLFNLCNHQWMSAINAEARHAGLDVVLTGAMGNLSISYAGLERLPELVRAGKWLVWLREGCALARRRAMRWRGIAVASLGPWMPGWLWRGLHRLTGRGFGGLHDYSALDPARAAALDIAGRASAHGLDPDYRPRRDGFESRLWVLRRIDPGNFNKGALAGWGVDLRDPTADRWLIEFCLSLPMDAFLADGRLRALGAAAFADRLPAEVLGEQRKGLQAVDWHESLAASHDTLRMEAERLRDVAAADDVLDLDRMQRLADNLPDGGWHRSEATNAYRLVLLRGIAAGHFLRKASRSNA